MKSFAIVYKSKENNFSENFKVDLHINLWDLESNDPDYNICLDIGLKINSFREVEKIRFYFPLEVKENDVIDLHDKMVRTEIASLIFNDGDCAIKSQQGKYSTIELSEDSQPRYLLTFKPNISIHEKEEGDDKYTVIEYDLGRISSEIGNDNNSNAYLRFRIYTTGLKEMLWLDSKLDNYFLESAFTSNQIIDFKVNEYRNIATDFIKDCKLNNYRFTPFEKVHFLLAEPASAELEFLGTENISCRTLEENEWDLYLEEKYNTKDALVYHIKRKDKTRDFSCLVRSSIKETDWKLILIYILVVITINVVSTVAYDGLKCLSSYF